MPDALVPNDAAPRGRGFIVQQWRCKQDAQGNPRRLLAIFSPLTGALLAAYDEGYGGRAPLFRYFERIDAHSIELPAVTITPTEYRDILKTHRLSIPAG